MWCRVCIGDCHQSCIELLNSSGQNTSVYNTVAKYFEMEMIPEVKEEFRSEQIRETAELTAQVICTTCWCHINDFHKWREEVMILQKQRLKQLQQRDLLESVKLEMEMDMKNVVTYADPFAADICDNEDTFPEDPVAICETKFADRPTKLPTMEDINDKHWDNDRDYDNMPLLGRKKKEMKRAAANKISRIIKKTRAQKKPSELRSSMGKGKDEINLPDKAEKKSAKTKDALIAQYFKEQLPCELCGNLSADFTELRLHFREVHKIEKGYVLCCKQKYTERCHFVDHLQVHLNPQKYQCSECDKCSASGRSLVAHMRSVHRPHPLERRFECEICHKKFAKQSILKGHLETHLEGNPDYLCKECGKGFVLERRLNIHIRNVHSTSYRSVCDQCGKSFRGSNALRSHMVEHEGGSKKRWACDQCDAQLHSKFSLKRHKRVAHPDESIEYICGECGKIAFTEGALKSHKRYMHQQERIHKCAVCDKAFKASQALKEHMTTHTGEDLYQCPHCPRTFKVNANLHHHRKRKHPKEWEQNRRQRQMSFKRVDLSSIANGVKL